MRNSSTALPGQAQGDQCPAGFETAVGVESGPPSPNPGPRKNSLPSRTTSGNSPSQTPVSGGYPSPEARGRYPEDHSHLLTGGRSGSMECDGRRNPRTRLLEICSFTARRNTSLMRSEETPSLSRMLSVKRPGKEKESRYQRKWRWGMCTGQVFPHPLHALHVPEGNAPLSPQVKRTAPSGKGAEGIGGVVMGTIVFVLVVSRSWSRREKPGGGPSRKQSDRNPAARPRKNDPLARASQPATNKVPGRQRRADEIKRGKEFLRKEDGLFRVFLVPGDICSRKTTMAIP